MRSKLFIVFFLQHFLTIYGAKFIAGKSCGTLTPIKTIKTLPTDPEELENLECVWVEDEKAYKKYLDDKPSKISNGINKTSFLGFIFNRVDESRSLVDMFCDV